MLDELEEFISEKVTNVPNNIFAARATLRKISIPNAVTVNAYNAFGCTALYYVDFGSPTNKLNNCFIGSHNLRTIILRRTDAIVELHSKITGNCNNLLNGVTKIYVPRALIADYQANGNWSQFAAQFQPLEDYTVDGTAAGVFDESRVVE